MLPGVPTLFTASTTIQSEGIRPELAEICSSGGAPLPSMSRPIREPHRALLGEGYGLTRRPISTSRLWTRRCAGPVPAACPCRDDVEIRDLDDSTKLLPPARKMSRGLHHRAAVDEGYWKKPRRAPKYCTHRHQQLDALAYRDTATWITTAGSIWSIARKT